jgi:hypothetical protein
MPHSSSGQGCKLLKLVTRVRLPYGVLFWVVMFQGGENALQAIWKGSIPLRSTSLVWGHGITGLPLLCTQMIGVRLPVIPLVLMGPSLSGNSTRLLPENYRGFESHRTHLFAFVT